MPELDFSPLGDLYNTYRQAQSRATRERVLGQLGQASGPLDYGQAAKQLLAAGDTEGGMSLAKLAQQQYLTSPEYITKAKTAEAQVAEQFAPKTVNIKQPGGEEVTVQKGPKGYEIPTIQGMPASTADPIPAGVDPKKYREGLATAQVTNQETAVKDAKAAADFQPIIDQALSAYERAIKAGAIGPYAGSWVNRVNDKYNPLLRYVGNPEAENARQDYDKALAALQARITAAQNKGEGAVSNFERQMYAAQFPDLTMMDPAKGLDYLKQIQQQTKQTVSAGNATPLGRAPVVQSVIERPSIPGGNQIPERPADPNAWKTKETISAARANPQAALSEAQQAVQRGADPRAVAQRLQQIGIDPSPLFQNSGFAGPGQR